MIAKQGWRLIHVTRSLFYRYFPTCSFMEAVLRNNRSYVLAWQIGDGRTIGVSSHKWHTSSQVADRSLGVKDSKKEAN